MCLVFAQNVFVVDFSPAVPSHRLDASSARHLMQKNADALLLTLPSEPLDLAVFPEYALTGPDVIPPDVFALDVPPLFASACSVDNVLASFCEVARQRSTYIVVDLVERAVCGATGTPAVRGGCEEGTLVFFNAAVALDRKGRVVAIYRKSHLYFEGQLNQPLVPRAVWFDTDFGLRVGLMICFDIMFAQPLSDLLAAGVTMIAYPTWWVNTPPLINAIQTQSAFAATYNITLLASGIGRSNLTSGSGVYVGDTSLTTAFDNLSSPRTRHLAAILPPILPTPIVTTHPAVILSTDTTTRITRFLLSSRNTATSRMGNTTCTAAWTFDPSSDDDVFALVAFEGRHNGLFPLSFCALMRCLDSTCKPFTIASQSSLSSYRVSATLSRPSSDYAFTMLDQGAIDPSMRYDRMQRTLTGGDSSHFFVSATIWMNDF